MGIRCGMFGIMLMMLGCSDPGRDRPAEDGGEPITPADGGRPPELVDASDISTGCSGSGLLSVDDDGDRFSENDGDCNDCSPQINPGALDFPGNTHDEDCSGTDATAEESSCDLGIAMTSTAGADGARAIGLCRFTTEEGNDWGVISAHYVTPNGLAGLPSAAQVGILPTFGAATPVEGGSLFAISSGIARAPGQAGFTEGSDFVSFSFMPNPAGFPQESAACPGVVSGSIYDGAALQLRIRVPSNAHSFSYQSNFYTYEYPTFICTSYNDFLVSIMEPAPEGTTGGNILFDQDGNLVSVNSSLFRVCTPGYHGGRNFPCPGGTALLAGTSFGDTEYQPGGATGWLTTTVPVVPGSIINLRFAIWDSGDPDYDSLALIDNFQWSVEEPEEVETVPVY